MDGLEFEFESDSGDWTKHTYECNHVTQWLLVEGCVVDKWVEVQERIGG